MSCCTTTVPNSVRKREPVGQTSRQAACVQCLQTSDSISQRSPVPPSPFARSGFSCSMNATCRQVLAESSPVLSYEFPLQTVPSAGMRVPLLARDLAGLAADADRRVGEEADALLLLVAVRLEAVR